MASIQTIITFIIVFGVIVIVHEFGHFYFAKKSGILVREFAIGMGPKIFSHVGKDGTAYSLRMLPLGGYVRMAGWNDEDTEIKKGTPVGIKLNQKQLVEEINLKLESGSAGYLPMYVTDYDFVDKLSISGEVNGEEKTYQVDHDATIIETDGTKLRIAPKDVQYQNASVKGRLMTTFAGPMNNFILGFVLFTVVAFMQGSVPDTSTNRIGEVAMDSAAARAGLKEGDQVESINGHKVPNWQDMVDNISASKGADLKFKLERSGKEKNITVKPMETSSGYIIGIATARKTGFMDKLSGGFTASVNASTAIIGGLGDLITKPSLNKLGGPVAMYQMSDQAAKEGITTVMTFMALLSINLGIFNLLPIPALDGGKLLITLIEGIRGKPMKQEHENAVTFVAVIFMAILMIAVTWNDFMRIF